MRLQDLPFDSGIDEATRTHGSVQTTALKKCINLWHERRGILSPRPGSNAVFLNIPNGESFHVGAIGNAAGSNLYCLGRELWGQSHMTVSDSSVLDEENASLGLLPGFFPWSSRQIGKTYDSGSMTETERCDWCIWFQLAIHVQHTEDSTNPTTITAMDLNTGMVTAQKDISETEPCVAYHGITNGVVSPDVFAWDGTDVVRYTMSDRDLGVFDSGASEFTPSTAVTDLRAVGYRGGDRKSYVFAATSTDVEVWRVEPTGTTTKIGSLNAPSAVGRRFAVLEGAADDEAYVCYSSAGNLYVYKFSGGSQEYNVAVADPTGITAVCLGLPDSDSTYDVDVYVTIDGGAGDQKIRKYSAKSGSLDPHNPNVIILNAHALGGTFVEDGRAYLWILANRNGDSLYQKMALMDVSDGISPSGGPRRMAEIISNDRHWSVTRGYTAPKSRVADVISARPRRHMFVAGNIYSSSGFDNVLGFGLYQFVSHKDSQRQIIESNGSAIFPGGQLMQWQGGDPRESLHYLAPVILSTAGTSGGSLTTSSDYRFTATFTYRDANNIEHESAPSEVKTISIGSNTAVDVEISSPPTEAIFMSVRINLYRSKADGSIFQLDKAEMPGHITGTVTITSTQSDSDLGDNPFLHTEGGGLARDAAPASSFGAVGKRRLFLGGLFKEDRVAFSTEFLPGETPAFPDVSSHKLDMGERVNGLASIDDSIVILCRRSVRVVTGPGPDDTGAGSFSIRTVSHAVGCDDWRSVAVARSGVFFHGNGAYWLLPRGFSAPQNIGINIQDTLDAYPVVTSSTVSEYGTQQLLHVLLADTSATSPSRKHMVYSVDSGQWYEWAVNGVGATYDPAVTGNIIVNPWVTVNAFTKPEATDSDGIIMHEDRTGAVTDLTASATTQFSCEIETHDIHPWGLAAEGMVRSVWLRVDIDASPDPNIWAVDFDINGGEQTDSVAIGTDPLAANGWRNQEWNLPNTRVNSFTFHATMTPVHVAGITFEYESKGSAKVETAFRRG